MSIDRLLVFIVVGLTCLLIGGMGGLFLGATSEQESFIEALARANFTPECKTQVEAALRGGGAPPTNP
jgi:hypothetical protein